MATFPVKYINNAMRGAPVLNGVAGSLIGLLDTFLVDGWGLATANSLSVSGGVATLDHLRALARAGLPAVVVGRALYDRRFTLPEAIAAAREVG